MAEERDITAPLMVEELQAGWARKGEERPRVHARTHFGAKTDLGRVRENNEDKFDFLEPDEPAVLARKGRFYAVADGMGGHSAGQIASELALTTTIRTYYADPQTDIEASLRVAVEAANDYLVDVARTISSRHGMGTTLTAAVVREDALYIAHVGDSRIYLIRDGEMYQLSEDHSWVAEQVRRGAMSLEEAEQSPYRNVITRSLGGAETVEADILAVELRAGDRFLLCSDGLSGMLSDADLLAIAGTGSPSAAAWDLIDRANRSGGKDNITAFILVVEEIVPYVEGERQDAELRSDAEVTETRVASAAGASGRSAPCDGASSGPAAQEAKAEPRRGLMRGLFGRADRGT